MVPEPAAAADLTSSTPLLLSRRPCQRPLCSRPRTSLYGFKQPDPAPFLLFAERLQALPNGGVPFKMFNLTTDHIGYLTRPVESAQVILEAVEYLGG